MSDELLRVGLAWVLRRRLRRWWRELLVWLRVRRITPRRSDRLPALLVQVEPLDTGGGYRPKHRPQDPAKDPHEPYGGESSSRGEEHGWSGCTMSAGADALAYQTGGALTPWGGDLRHRQGDLDGGTDLVDLKEAWAAYGETLTIRSGSGWSELVEAHKQGRAIVVQGLGEVPGAGSFDGGHACAIGPETHPDGPWLFGDPLASDWQWINPGAIRSWAERWDADVSFAVSQLPPAPEPEPEPEPPKPPAPPALTYAEGLEDGYASGVAAGLDMGGLVAGDQAFALWLAWLEAGPSGPGDRWDVGSWGPPPPPPPMRWARGDLPAPAPDAAHALASEASWDAASWAGALWRGSEVGEPGDAALGAF